MIFPVIWMVITGFKQEADAYTSSPTLIFQPTLDQFQLALNSGFSAYLLNSIVASVVSTAIAMLLGVPAAYCMVFQLRKKSSNDMLFFVLSTRFMPFAAILVPLYVIVAHLNLLDNLFTLIIHCLHGNESTAHYLDGTFVFSGFAKRSVRRGLVRWQQYAAHNCQRGGVDGRARPGRSGPPRHHFCLERLLFCGNINLYAIADPPYHGSRLF